MVVILAVLIDAILGDPPNRWHPTAWMGSLIATLGRRHHRRGALPDLLEGAAVVGVGTAVAGLAGVVVTRLAAQLPGPARTLAVAAVLSTTISARGLDRAALEVQRALSAGDLEGARRSLAWHLVSRDVATLSGPQVAAAAIESVAENASDGVVAPLAWYMLGGLPAALAYRFVNTADAMLGYRDPEREWYGKPAARLDDLLNLVPARLTGLGITVAAPAAGGTPAAAWAVMRRDASRTASPNAGVPMGAMSGALSVVLEKPGHYRLGEAGREPDHGDVRRARRVLVVVSALSVTAAALQAWGRR